jgi:hypothetical protein
MMSRHRKCREKEIALRSQSVNAMDSMKKLSPPGLKYLVVQLTSKSGDIASMMQMG